MKNKKMWSMLVQLSMNCQGFKFDTRLPFDFDDDVWETILKKSADSGINTIVLDLGDGVCYGSHPELANKGAWTRQRVRSEVKKARDMGITIIPKLNFSATHDLWLGEYGNMLTTPAYYKVCRDLINEVYDLFDCPDYIHIGMDEEDEDHFTKEFGLYICRFGEALWHDLQFLLDCVRDTGATPWMWTDCLFNYPEEFYEHIGTKDLILSPWYYHALREEHYTLISSGQEYIDYYSQEKFKGQNLKYVEDDIFHTRFRDCALPNLKRGYTYVPCMSVYNHCQYNTPDVVEYFKTKAPENSIAGFITAPWCETTKENLPKFEESIRLLQKAREEFYPEERALS